ncbi:high affinity monosaccharide transporter [Stipitochalara longipes BDJ]|nr:high affinity monosaccharide transporter [Stipitochalara longipes BDJ]
MSSITQNPAEVLEPTLTVQEAIPVQAPTPATRSPAPITWKVIVFCAYASFGGILFGYDSGYINGVLGMKEFKKDFGRAGWVNTPEAYDGYLYESWQKSVITSILSAGTLVGALVAGFFADKLGRRSTIILGCTIYIIGVVVQVIAQAVNLLIVGRAIAGVGVGFVSATVVMYVSEISPQKIRGRLVGAYQMAITLGFLLSACVNYGTKDYQNTGAYRIPIALQFLWALILGCGLLLMPESPRWYVMKDKPEPARKSLAKFRDQDLQSAFVEMEFQELQISWTKESKQENNGSGWIDCFRGRNLRRTFIGTAIQMMQQLTGVNFIFYFGTTFFETIGIGDPFRISIILAAVNTVTTPIAFWTIDKFGRRPLLIWGALGMCVCQFIVAIVGVVTGRESTAAHDVLITFVCIYIAFFASTWGPTGWAVSGEVFPLSIRAKGIALSTASNWLWNFIIAFVTPYIVDTDKGDLGVKVFFIWGSTCALSLLFAYFCVYETKGLSLEQIDDMFEKTTARRSSKWRPASRPDENRDVEMAEPQNVPASHVQQASRLASAMQAEKEEEAVFDKERVSESSKSS